MNTCKTCKWWSGPSRNGAPEAWHGPIEWPVMGTCSHPKLCPEVSDPIGEKKIIPPDALHCGEAWSSPETPFTGPDFGCVHHEIKIPASARAEEA